MKKGFLPPLAVLALLLAFSLWNSAVISTDTTRWQAQLRQSDALAQAGDWPAAVSVLTDSYRDWTQRQGYLHIVTQHDAVDDAEAMYHRCLAFAAAKEDSEFRAELADLRAQLALLAEMERPTVRNIL